MHQIRLDQCIISDEDLSCLTRTKKGTMAQVQRGRGGSRPNRGGGRHRTPRGRGCGSGKSASSQPFEYGNVKSEDIEADDVVVDFKAKPEEQNTRRKRTSYKISVQKLSMTPETLEMVMDTLLHLNENPNLAKKDGQPQASRGFRCLPSPLDFGMEDVLQALPRSHHFKLDSRLVIEDSISNTGRPEDDPELLYQFQVKKLQKYGFDRTRCLNALTSQDGDIGGSIELLLAQCLPEFHTELETTLIEAKEQREDEALALSSIYGDKFSEKIPNRIWLIDLDLPQLTKLTIRKNECPSPDRRQICDYYLRGNCKFGNRCRLRHVSKAELEADHERASQSLFHVEIRFPHESLYPYQPPLVAFLSQSFYVKPDLCLKISARLMREASEMATDGYPAVFTIIALLDDPEEVKRILDTSPHPLSLPPKTMRKPAPEPEIADESLSDSTENYSDDEETLPVITDYLSPEKRLGKDTHEECAVTLALKRRQKEDKLYARSLERLQEDNITIRRKFKKMQSNMTYQKMVNHRKELPAWSKRGDIVRTVKENQFIVISGTTGCGKTTQVPQFVLDACIENPHCDLGQIICTQPRRISALAVAERVAQERNERLGDVVGYQIRMESRLSPYTRLMYCTTGILLRRLETDTALIGVSHVIIDEVHERSEDSDFLMMILRGLCRKRPDLKLVLMSATLNADMFSQYFYACAVIDIPGKTFPVTRRYLEDVVELTEYTVNSQSPYVRQKAAPLRERALRQVREHEIEDEANGDGPTAVKGKIDDSYLSHKQMALRYVGYSLATVKTLLAMDLEKINNDLIEALLKYIVKTNVALPRDGAILIFLPGFMEINSLYEQLSSVKPFSERSRFSLIPLHSTLSSDEQQVVFKKSRPGMTKIILATNIAETSITIDDVVYVIDAGRMKERRYDANRNMESLDLCWVSCANAIQREGRAGRVAPGICYHLFTDNQFRHQFRDQPVPEIQRVPLEQMVLKIKILDIFHDMDVRDVMNQLLEPPHADSVTAAIERLQDLGALDREQRLTPLGYHLAFLPVDVRIGKLMLYGVIMRCLDSALTIAASLSYKTPFLSPFTKREEANARKEELTIMNSDHLTILRAYNAWLEADRMGAGHAFCEHNFLSLKTLKMLSSLKRQYVELLSDIGFVTGDVGMKRLERSACRGSDGVKENIPAELNCNSSNMKIVSSVLCAALYPHVVQMITPEQRYYESGAGAMAKKPNAEELKFKTKTDGYVFIHPSSVNFKTRTYESPFLVYHEKIKTSKVYLRDCSMVSPYSLILLAGGKVHIALDREKFVLFIDEGWIRFTAQNYQVASLVQKLREKLDHLLQEKIENPELNLATCPRGSKIIATIVKLLTSQ